MKIIIKLNAIMLALTMCSCGYTFRGSETALPPDVKKIYIPQVVNESTKLGLSQIVTEALRDEFDGYGTVSIVDSQSEADAVLRVRIIDVKETTSATRSNNNTALQMQTTMFLAGEMQRITGPVLWRNNALRVSETFGADSSVVVRSSLGFASGPIGPNDLAGLSNREISRGQEAGALRSLASTAARQMYDQAVAPDF